MRGIMVYSNMLTAHAHILKPWGSVLVLFVCLIKSGLQDLQDFIQDFQDFIYCFGPQGL